MSILLFIHLEKITIKNNKEELIIPKHFFGLWVKKQIKKEKPIFGLI